MRKLCLTVSAVVLSAVGAVAGEEYELPSDGIRIRKCAYDRHGVSVTFETALPPPYVVGIFRADDLGLSRDFPIRYKISGEKSAYITGDYFSKKNTFVQVFTDSISTNEHFRELSDAEVTEYFNTTASAMSMNSIASKVEDIWSERFNANNMALVGDHTWVSFFPTNIPSIRLGLNGMYRPPQPHREWEKKPWLHPRAKCRIKDDDGEEIEVYRSICWTRTDADAYITNSVYSQIVCVRVGYYSTRTNSVGQVFKYPRTGVITWMPYNMDPVDSDVPEIESNVVSRIYGPYDTSVGCGYRITFHDDTSTFDVERAISARPDRSQEVVIRKPFKSLSAHDGIKVTVDWRGEITYAVETNAVPDRIYWEGI